MSKLAHAERARRLKVISKENPLPLDTKVRHSTLVVGALMEAQKPNETWGLTDPVRRGSWTVDTPSFAALLDLDAEHADEDIVTVQTGLGGAFFSDSLSKLLRCESHKPALELAVKILESYEKLKRDKDSLDNISEHITESFDEILCFCRTTTGKW